MAEYHYMKKSVSDFTEVIRDKRLQKMYQECFYSTLDTTAELLSDGTSYVFTGDIPAMWLRDSSVQVTGYLPYAKEDADVAKLIKGLIKRQFYYIAIDPYANAFNKTDNNAGHHDDITDYDNPMVWERKYEIDSLCYPMWLVKKYYEATGDRSVYEESYRDTAKLILDLFITEQRHFENSDYIHYRPKYPQYPTLNFEGKGNPVGYTGMTWSGYRPSDDVCDYNYLVPSNMFAAVIMREFIKVFTDFIPDAILKEKSERLLSDIEDGIKKFAIIKHEEFGEIFAFEVDGLGNYLLMDDANVPSLLSLPYLGYCDVNDRIYQNTRKFILSKNNPYYYEGTAAKGIGSPHTPARHIWHIAIIIRMLTSIDSEEISECYKMLTSTDADTGVMHESFHADNPKVFTREWFAWANTLFSIALKTYYENKHTDMDTGSQGARADTNNRERV